MRKQVVVCDICNSEVDLSFWVHLPFRKHYLAHALKGGVDLCGKSCENIFLTYYEHYIGDHPYEFM